MLHAVKKKVALVATNTNAPAEFLDYKQRLASVKKNISSSLLGMDECSRHWMKGIADQRNFSSAFAEGYPMSHDETHSIAMKFAQGARDRHDYFTRYSSPEEARYQRMIEQLRGYVEEIDSIENMYPSLIEAKSEADRYQSKLDSMEHKRVSDEKISRNIVKHDNEHDRYVALASEVVEAQKRAYAKAPIAYKMLLLAYWHANSRHVEIANKSLESTSDWVRSNEADMLAADLANMDVHDLPEYIPAPHTYAATPNAPVGLVGSTEVNRDVPVTHSHMPHTNPVGGTLGDSHMPYTTSTEGTLGHSHMPTHTTISLEGDHSHMPHTTTPTGGVLDHGHSTPDTVLGMERGDTEVETIETPTGTTVIEKTKLPVTPGSTEQDVLVKATATERVRVPINNAEPI